MSNQKEKTPNFEEIVFENRNKEYGAYYIRRIYKKHVIIAMIISAIILIVTVGTPFIMASLREGQKVNIEKDVSAELVDMEKPEDEPPPPPPPPPPPAAMEQQVKFTAPVVVDTVVEVKIATADEISESTSDEAVVEVKQEVKQEVVEEAPKEVFFIVEEMPEFPGGDIALRKYIAENVKYPQIARENDIKGKVYVRFCVTYKGMVDQVSIARGVDPLLDEEAIRVVKSLPQWKPGKQRGKPVNVWYTVPINFTLQ